MKLTVSELRARIKKTCKGLSAVEMGMEINELYPALARRIIKKADEAAVALLKEGLSIEMISRCINIPLEHVKELAAQLEK